MELIKLGDGCLKMNAAWAGGRSGMLAKVARAVDEFTLIRIAVEGLVHRQGIAAQCSLAVGVIHPALLGTPLSPIWAQGGMAP
jgi:uncharacterized membrane protein